MNKLPEYAMAKRTYVQQKVAAANRINGNAVIAWIVSRELMSDDERETEFAAWLVDHRAAEQEALDLADARTIAFKADKQASLATLDIVQATVSRALGIPVQDVLQAEPVEKITLVEPSPPGRA